MREITSRGSWQSLNGYANARSHIRANLLISLPLILPIQEAANPTYLLAWIPESLLDEKGQSEWDKFVSVEGKAPYDEEEGWSDRLRSWTALTALDAIRCRSH